MDKFLNSLPKNIVAFLAISGGIIFIVLSQPPVTVCDSQVEKFKAMQINFLYRDEKYPKAKNIKRTKFEYLRDRCKETNSPGGCYELFSDMKLMLHDLALFTDECAANSGGISEVKRSSWETVDLLIRLAWGASPPSAYNIKFSWLDTADVSLYCQLKNRIILMYGESSWSSFREKLMRDLPGAKELTRNQVWDMSLFSENCARYP